MHTKSSANTLLLRKQLQAPLQMSSRAHKASKCNVQSLPFGQASSKRRRYTRGYTSQTNAASLKAGSRHGSGGHQAGWTTLSVHLLQREQRQCDEAYLDAHECTLRVCSIPSIAVQPGHTTQSLLQPIYRDLTRATVCFQGNLGSRKLHPAIACWMGKKFAPAG
jgi:hypothetical protein